MLDSKKHKTEKACRIAWWMLATATLILVMLIRVRLLQVPLERDEGEFAYGGQLILQGIAPYSLCYTMKLPGAHAAYALIMAVFGQTIAAIHLGLLLVNVASIILIFILGRRLFGEQAGLAAAAVYAVLSLDRTMLGLAAHATHFVVLFVLIATLLLLDSLNRRSTLRLFSSGFFFGMAVLMKQPAVSFAAFGFVYLLFFKLRNQTGVRGMLKAGAAYAASCLLPLLLTCALLLKAGIFRRFWFLTIEYATAYATEVAISDAPRVFYVQFSRIFASTWPSWLLAAAGILVLALRRDYRSSGTLVTLLSGFSILALSAGFYFRQHYFILILPGVSLLCSAAVAGSNRFQEKLAILRYAMIFVVAGALIVPIFVHRQLYFILDDDAASRRIYGNSPFPESFRVGTYLREHSKRGDTIAVLGSEPEIYFYAQRNSATGYIYMYPLMESQKFAKSMQHEMEREIEAARPGYIVASTVATSWLVQPDSDKTILDWANAYCETEYEQAGLIHITDRGSDYFWDNIPRVVSPDSIAIYKRKL